MLRREPWRAYGWIFKSAHGHSDSLLTLFPNHEPIWKCEASVENNVVGREGVTIVPPSQNDKQHITRCSFYVFIGKNNSFSSEKSLFWRKM